MWYLIQEKRFPEQHLNLHLQSVTKYCGTNPFCLKKYAYNPFFVGDCLKTKTYFDWDLP